jgi:hypothetical protein
VAFASVGDDVRLSLPSRIKFMTSSTYGELIDNKSHTLAGDAVVSPGTLIFCCASSRRRRGLLSSTGTSKSRIVSLYISRNDKDTVTVLSVKAAQRSNSSCVVK